MAALEQKRFESPEETRTFTEGKGKVDIVGVGQLQIGQPQTPRITFKVTHVRPARRSPNR